MKCKHLLFDENGITLVPDKDEPGYSHRVPEGGEGTAMEELTAEQIRQNLQDAGFTPRAAADFMDCWQAGNRRQQLCLLTRQRNCLLDSIHKQERQISCLDYLVYCLGRCEPSCRKNGR